LGCFTMPQVGARYSLRSGILNLTCLSEPPGSGVVKILVPGLYPYENHNLWRGSLALAIKKSSQVTPPSSQA
jgi:hypothetical protein